jgi:signal transduction histidine kinase
LKKYVKDYIENNEIIKNIWKENIVISYKIKKDIFLDLEENTFNILFWNLLSNAIKFSVNNLKNNKKIKLEIWLNNKNFYILDNWIWIKKENLKSIWDKFFRTDKNTEWFGIWLFLVKRISILYNWDIEVESIEKQKTKFIIKYKK